MALQLLLVTIIQVFLFNFIYSLYMSVELNEDRDTSSRYSVRDAQVQYTTSHPSLKNSRPVVHYHKYEAFSNRNENFGNPDSAEELSGPLAEKQPGARVESSNGVRDDGVRYTARHGGERLKNASPAVHYHNYKRSSGPDRVESSFEITSAKKPAGDNIRTLNVGVQYTARHTGGSLKNSSLVVRHHDRKQSSGPDRAAAGNFENPNLAEDLRKPLLLAEKRAMLRLRFRLEMVEWHLLQRRTL